MLAHLETCPACRSAVEEFDTLRDLLKPDPQVQPDGGWEAFEERTALSIGQRMHGSPPLYALAACLLIGLVGLEIGRQFPARDSTHPQMVHQALPTAPAHPSSAPSVFTHNDIHTAVQTFRQVSQVFENQASWVLLSESKGDGVGVGHTSVRPDQPILLLRLVMFNDKSVVTSSDLVIIPGQPADLTLPVRDGKQLHTT